MTDMNIYRAIGGLDPDLIEKAAPGERAQKKKTNTWLKWVSLAACLSVFAAAIIPLIIQINDHNVEPEGFSVHFVGEEVESAYFVVELTSTYPEEMKCTFTLIKKNNEPIWFCIEGDVYLDEFTDENGVSMKNFQRYHLITPYDNYREAASNHIVLDNKLMITVNGKRVDSIPTAPGEYTVTLDYSAAAELLDNYSPFVKIKSFDGGFQLDDYDLWEDHH